MALQKDDIKSAVKSAFDAALSVDDPEQRDDAMEALAEAFAQAIGDAVEVGINSADVNFTLQAGTDPVAGEISLSANVG